MSFTIPSGSVVQVGLTPPILGGKYVWSVSGGNGSYKVINDGTAILYTAGSTGDTVGVSNYEKNPWRAKKLYRINDTVIDSNGYLQTVFSVSANIQTSSDILDESHLSGEPISVHQVTVDFGALASVTLAVSSGVATLSFAGASPSAPPAGLTVGSHITLSNLDDSGHDVSGQNGTFQIASITAHTITWNGAASLSGTKTLTGGDLAQPAPLPNISVTQGYSGDVNNPQYTEAYNQAGFSSDGLVNHSEDGFDDMWFPDTFYAVGQRIIDAKGNVQMVTTAGKSGTGTIQATHPTPSTHDPLIYRYQRNLIVGPTWATTAGSTTSDGSVTWTMEGPAGQPNWARTSGGLTVDGDLTWRRSASAVADSDTWDPITFVVGSTGVIPYGNYFLLPRE